MTAEGFDHVVDVLIVGSGGGGMAAALTAHASGLDTLVVEKSSHFGGSTALSGGGIWVPGAPAQRREGYAPEPEGVVGYLLTIMAAALTLASRTSFAADKLVFQLSYLPSPNLRMPAELLLTVS